MEITLKLVRLVKAQDGLRAAAADLASKASDGMVLRACIHFMLSMLKFHATGVDPPMFTIMGRGKRGWREYRALLIALSLASGARAACGIAMHAE